ncbi:MAG: discoidin domain-containing protein [Spirochaetales bacterium]|nr:discoidin domain-containing protein [Spirochaetales bacterium]
MIKPSAIPITKKIILLSFSVLLFSTITVTTLHGQINGAVYWPATAYNVDQFWSEYSSSVTERDFGFAQSVKINALRVFGSYYVYTQNSSTYENNVRDLLAKAGEKGIRILYVIYEGCGKNADDPINRTLKDPLRAVASKSPPSAVTTNSSLWQPYRDHVVWFMNRFRDDNRLISIEIMNEPNADDKAFAHDMTRTAVSLKGAIPISVGTLPGQFLEYVSDGVDVLQFHNNFPTSLTNSANIIQDFINKANNAGKPVWMTEWQRLRPSGANWDGSVAVPEAERFTDLASMANQVKSYQNQMGAFFWSLMVKPAYLEGQRNAGTINGLFWEDGAVWDLAGARIISDNPNLNLPERKRIPFYTLRFENKEFTRWLQCTDVTDGTGAGNNVQAVAGTYTGNKTKWRIVRIDNDAYFRLENVEYNLWLQCTSAADATNGQPDATNDASTFAVRAVGKSNTGDRTKWRWVPSGAGDWYFFLQNKYTGYYLQVTDITDVDGAGYDGGTQVRCVPSTKTGSWTRFKSIDASDPIGNPPATPVPTATNTPTWTPTRTPVPTTAATSTPTPTQVVSGTDRTDAGGTITAQYDDSPSGEDMAKAFDNNSNTKYLTFHASGWIQFQFTGGNTYAVNGYALTSANDAPERDPYTWTLQGSNNGTSWTTIDSRSGEDFPNRFQRRIFTFGNTMAYNYIRLNMTNNSGTILQIAEIELFGDADGTAATATPTNTTAATATPTNTTAATSTPAPTQAPSSGFTDDFNDNSIGNAWTMYSGNWSENGGILRQDSSTQGDPCKAIAGSTGLSLDSNQTITAKVYVDTWSDGDSARAGVSLFTGTGDGRGYNLLFHNNHSTVQFLDDMTAWGTSYTFNWSDRTWYWFTLKMENGTLYGKIWQDGSAEPSNWPYTWTRSGRTGYPALNGGTSGHGGSCTVFFDDVKITSP